jgi:putative isomerase
MKSLFSLILCTAMLHSIASAEHASDGHSPQYNAVQQQLMSVWNTFNLLNLSSQVILPEGMAVNVGFYREKPKNMIRAATMGQPGISPGPRSYDGSYTELVMQTSTFNVTIQSASLGDSLVELVTPLDPTDTTANVIVFGEVLFDRDGMIELNDQGLLGTFSTRTIPVYGTAPYVDYAIKMVQPHFLMPLKGPVGISTHKKRTLSEIQTIINQRRIDRMAQSGQYGQLADAYEAMQQVIAWNTIYEPGKNRVFTTVSRQWANRFNGYVLFCWDTYFAAYMCALDCRELAYANAVEITSAITKRGFVPNYEAGNNRMSWDRSQPPVGSMMVKEIFRRFHEKWFLVEVYNQLLNWNRWWEKNRNKDGLLCWGTNPLEPGDVEEGSSDQVNAWQGAAYESGLDNSPMYDGVPFNSDTHIMELADVGLTSLYVMDCEALSEIAKILSRTDDAEELKNRAAAFRSRLNTLWNEEKGIYLNKRTDTNEISTRMSPTNFYPLLARAATTEQAARMINDHLLNSTEFWGQWALPSISFNDPGYDNNYWRGRIWGPMNFLVYLGMRNYHLVQAQNELAEKSRALLLKDWMANHHVHENYNSSTGEGDDANAGDPFYHWGALLGFISFLEAGYLEPPEEEITGIFNSQENPDGKIYFQLCGNYPNPFNPETTLAFSIENREYICIDIYDALGRKIRTLVNQSYQPGIYRVHWNGRDESDQVVAGGVYFARLSSPGKSQMIKMCLTR